MNFQKFKTLSLLFIVIFMFFTNCPMDRQQAPSNKAMFKDPYDDNPIACCLCGLVVCTCTTGAVGCLALTEGLPVTAALWWLASGASALCLQEIYYGYKDEQKRLASELFKDQ